MTSLSLNSFRTGSICGSILKVENETVTDTVPAVFLSWTKEKDTKTKGATQGGKIQTGFFKNM